LFVAHAPTTPFDAAKTQFKTLEVVEGFRLSSDSGHGVSAANPACEVSNIAIVDGEPPKREENDNETLRWN
jgi:hypothetical protein